MKIGLLQCDHVAPELQSRFGDYNDFFVRLFQGRGDVIFAVFDVVQGEYPASVHECDGYISTGSRFSVYDDEPWIRWFKQFVRELYFQKQKFVGVCFGHQMIAEALGGRCGKADAGWGIGVKEVVIQNRRGWMTPEQNRYRLLVSHQDQILQLPPEARVVGENSHCPVSMLMVGDHFLGIQAHPEFTPDYARELMRMRTDRIGLAAVTAAENTLDQQTDESVIAGWMISFWEK